MANEITPGTIHGLLNGPKVKSQIINALPRVGLTADRMIRVALTQIRKNPALLRCTQDSLLGAIISSAQIGLEPDPTTGFAYLVPYGKECTLIPGYKGMMELAWRSGKVGSIMPGVIYEADDYEFEYGLTPKLKHIPRTEGDRGAPIYYYAVAEIIIGEMKSAAFRIMTVKEVDAVKNRSRSASSGFSPWKTDYEAMAFKTVIRRLLKFVPKSIELTRAISLDEQAELHIPQNLEDVIDVDETNQVPQQVSKSELFGKEDKPNE